MSEMKVFKDFKFSAAHRLTKVPNGHQCAELHGHNYKVRIIVKGVLTDGWVIDFAEIKRAWEQRIKPYVDHKTLNSVSGLDNPTAENIAKWIWKRIALSGLHSITVWETDDCGAVYKGK